MRYDAAFEQLASSGVDVHGEADFVATFGPSRVLDAGCGTGRVAIELARRGVAVVGVDREESMLAQARRKAPHLEWHLADLATLKLVAPAFDAAVLAGNVMIFLDPGSEGKTVGNLTAHLRDNGLLVAGFQTDRSLSVAGYDDLCAAAGLELSGRWSTWDRAPWKPSDDYAVSVHYVKPRYQVR